MGLQTVLMDSSLEHPAGWICAACYKCCNESSSSCIDLLQHEQNVYQFENCCKVNLTSSKILLSQHLYIQLWI